MVISPSELQAKKLTARSLCQDSGVENRSHWIAADSGAGKLGFGQPSPDSLRCFRMLAALMRAWESASI